MSKLPISLERYRECVSICFKILSESDDGLTAYELEKMTGFPRSTVQTALMSNPLFYVDRWKITRKIHPTKVWVAAEVTRYEDCPRPEDMK